MDAKYKVEVTGNNTKTLTLSEVPAGTRFVIGHGQSIGACSVLSQGQDWKYSVADIAEINSMSSNSPAPDRNSPGFGKYISSISATEKSRLIGERITWSCRTLATILTFPLTGCRAHIPSCSFRPGKMA